jgi:putative Mn2+ efflux pump MntP
MPLLGMLIGSYLLNLLPFEHNFFLGIIFLILAFKMAFDFFIEKEEKITLNFLGIFLFSLSVSFDALTTGIGLLAITNKIFIATFIFMLVSYLFTFLGILLGKYVNQKLGKFSAVLGIIILLIMALYLII